jgi:hypothetical protein
MPVRIEFERVTRRTRSEASEALVVTRLRHTLGRRPQMRAPWIVAATALLIGATLAALFVGEAGFVSSLVATYLGAVLGFFVALYVDRIQRAEDAAAQRTAEEARVARDEVSRLAKERERRIAVLHLLREELAPIPQKMSTRQERAYLPSPWDRLSDTMWRAFSSSGETRWVTDLSLLRTVASAYELVSIEATLEDRWRQSMVDWSIAGRDVASEGIANELKSLDRDTWRLVCDACKALDEALVKDGAPPGSNSKDLICPY